MILAHSDGVECVVCYVNVVRVFQFPIPGTTTTSLTQTWVTIAVVASASAPFLPRQLVPQIWLLLKHVGRILSDSSTQLWHGRYAVML